MGLTPLAGDMLATVVTTLEMRERPRPTPLPQSLLRLARWHAADVGRYRTLFTRVGAPWLWYSRLAMDDARLRATLDRPDTQLHAVVDPAGIEVGMVEFSRPSADICSLDYFALVPELTGRGHGRWMMAMALAMMWRPGVAVVRVNTCTLDHPAALAFYRRAGFTPIGRKLEVAMDPRLTGVLPRSAAPGVPILDP